MSSFLDTNVLVYSVSDDDRKGRIATGLLKRKPAISVQCLNEFVNVALKKMKLGWDEIEQSRSVFIDACEVIPLTLGLHERAVSISQRHKFHIYDANIIAAAEASGADILYSEDLQAGRRFGDMEVVNPYG